LWKEGSYKQGKKHGNWTWWHADGRILAKEEYRFGKNVRDRSEGCFQSKDTHSPVRPLEWVGSALGLGAWCEDEEGEDDGRPPVTIERIAVDADRLVSWNYRGERLRECLRFRDVIDGACSAFGPDGRVLAVHSYRLGVLEGPFWRRDTQGRPSVLGAFKKGLPEGTWHGWQYDESCDAGTCARPRESTAVFLDGLLVAGGDFLNPGLFSLGTRQGPSARLFEHAPPTK
jgi:hypothetical protein